jgi:hypothetical protein
VHFCLAVATLFAVWLGAAMADADPFDLPLSDFDIRYCLEITVPYGNVLAYPDGG